MLADLCGALAFVRPSYKSAVYAVAAIIIVATAIIAAIALIINT